MGSSRTRKRSRQPQQLGLPDGEPRPFETGAERQETLPMTWLVHLVDLQLAALRASRRGERVDIVEAGLALNVIGRQGTLGRVAPHYQEVLREAGISTGVVASIELSTPAAFIRVWRPT